MIQIAWKQLSVTAKKPAKPKSNSDAGFDLYSDDELTILPNETKLVKTGYAVQMKPIPETWNVVGLIKDCSGNALKKCLVTSGGVIDEGYSGEIGVILSNHSTKSIEIKKGDKIAQLIPFLIPKTEEIPWQNRETKRGSDGYGSTGLAGE